MTPNMMKDPLSHIYFIVALLTSLIIHLSLVMYGGFQYTDIANFEISSDIELTIIQEPKMNTSSQKSPQERIQETPIKEPIKITNKSITPIANDMIFFILYISLSLYFFIKKKLFKKINLKQELIW